MSEEKEGFFSNLKNQIITGAGVALTTIGTVFVDEIKSIIGIADEEPVEQVQPAIENKQETNVNVAGPEISSETLSSAVAAKDSLVVNTTTALTPASAFVVSANTVTPRAPLARLSDNTYPLGKNVRDFTPPCG